MREESDTVETLIERLRERRHIYPRKVACAFRAVARERFIPERSRDQADADVPPDIGKGQTISAPHIVADIIELLDLKAGQKVLEIDIDAGREEYRKRR